MTPLPKHQSRRATEIFTAWWESTHPRLPGESAFMYYARAIHSLGTPEGMAAFRDACNQATKVEPCLKTPESSS